MHFIVPLHDPVLKKKKTHLLEVIQQFMKGKIIHLGSVFNLKFYSFTTNSEPWETAHYCVCSMKTVYLLPPFLHHTVW